MSSLASIVAARGPIKFGDPDSEDVRTLQQALSQAGYRVGVDGQFGDRTNMVVRQFQQQHGMAVDGVLGPMTAATLDVDHATLVVNAQGITSAAPAITEKTPEPWLPHDDTASLLAFYGDPRSNGDDANPVWKEQNVVTVPCPWTLYYEGVVWPHPVPIHKRLAVQLGNAFTKIWDAAGHDDESPILIHVRHFSGSGNYRPVRGSSRLSCHAFWAAIDWDAEHLPMRYPGQPRFTSADLPQPVYDAFKSEGWTLGVDFTGRQDVMHVQGAHE